jgi:lysozyme
MNKEALYNQLKIDEGIVYEVYLDHLGYPTFGIGHLILETDPEYGYEVGTPVFEDRVRECFDKDIDTAIAECVVLYGDAWEGFPDEVQEVLANMMFNMGRPTLSKFKNFNKQILAHNYAAAAPEGRDSRWFRQVGARAERLMARLEAV